MDASSSTQDAVDAFIAQTAALLGLERREEEQRAKGNRSIVGEVASIGSGLGGCALVRIEKLSVLKAAKDAAEDFAGTRKPDGKQGHKGAGKGKGKGGGARAPSITAVSGASFSAGDPVTIRKPNDAESEVVRGVVTSVGDRFMVVSVEEFDDDWCDTRILIAGVPDDVTYRRMRQALGLEVSPRPSLKGFAETPARRVVELAFGPLEPQYSRHIPGVHAETAPDTADESPVDLRELDASSSIPYWNTNLDASQRRAVDLAVRATDGFLILGPPGSGKTTTVIEVIYQLTRVCQKILVCAPSNVAADNIVERLAGRRKDVRVVRLGHVARLLPSVQAYALDAQVERSDGAALAQDIRRDIAQTYRRMQMLGRREKAERTKLRAEAKLLGKELRQKEARSVTYVVDHANVIVCTNTVANDRYLRHANFDVVVLDEAAQALEASCWIPILRAPKVILAGDPFQLPPTVLSQEASRQGLSRTLFDRLHQRFKDRVCHMLEVQYRMHAAICRWSSAEFYGGRLVGHPSVDQHRLVDLPGVEETDETAAPLVFVDTAGLQFEEQASEEGSKYNPLEAEAVAAYVRRLLAAGLSPDAVGVITPYSAQVSLLKELLRTAEMSSVEVSTVDGFQGREKEAIVLSMVRSNTEGNVGFLMDERRLNVAVTRARRHVAMIGDSATMASDPFLKRLYVYFEAHGDVYSAATYTDG
eukprot:EG_transcript_4909